MLLNKDFNLVDALNINGTMMEAVGANSRSPYLKTRPQTNYKLLVESTR